MTTPAARPAGGPWAAVAGRAHCGAPGSPWTLLARRGAGRARGGDVGRHRGRRPGAARCPLWLKPLKFALSFGLNALALAWMLGALDRWRRTGRAVGWVIVAASAVEVGVIAVQAGRGRRSHFNEETALDGSLYSLMGATVALIWFATALVAVLLLRQRLADPAMRWAIHLGLFVSLLGMALGMLMVGGGAHAVGVADGGPGVPLFGWSTVAGDLRVGHFVGIHALQVLPLLAAALAALGWASGRRRRAVWVAAAGYVGLVVLLTWQALRGQALVAPDGLTLFSLAVLVLAVGITGWVAVGRPDGPVAPAAGREEVLR